MKLLMYFYSIITSMFASNKQEVILEEVPNLPMRLGGLQFFADPPADPPADPAPEDKPFATFPTQVDLDNRLERAQREGQKALATSLGYESIEAMQEALKKPDDKPPKDDDKKDEPVDVDALIESKLKEERAKTFTRVLNSEVKVVANELGFVDHADALALADLSDVKENEKGDLEGVKEALEALAKVKPHLVKSASGTNFGSDITPKPKDNKEHLESIAKLAQSRGTHAQVANDPWKR